MIRLKEEHSGTFNYTRCYSSYWNGILDLHIKSNWCLLLEMVAKSFIFYSFSILNTIDNFIYQLKDITLKQNIKEYKIFLIFITLFMGLNIQANDLFLYKLYNNKLQAIFPSEPQKTSLSISDLHLIKEKLVARIPVEYREKMTQKEINTILSNALNIIKNNKPLVSIDRLKHISYTVSKSPSGLKHENYIYDGIQAQIDSQIKLSVQLNGQVLIDFSSKVDKYHDMYIAIYTCSSIQNGQTLYSSVKYIAYKDNTYRWQVGYFNKNDKIVFDDNQKYCKIIKGKTNVRSKI